MAQQVMNLTSIQGCRFNPQSHSVGQGIQQCRKFVAWASSCSSDPPPSPGISICRRYGPKKQKAKKKKKKEKDKKQTSSEP